jgi:hypothetical protein
MIYETINNDNKNDVNNTNINNYPCSLCKNYLINFYCLLCDKFVCKKCIEKCNLEKHENIKININDECISNINLYGKLTISNIEKKVNKIQEYNNELKVYDIKKKRDNLISMFNDIINLYSEIMKSLRNMYKEKDVKIAMSKYKLDSDKIKEEINEIIQKAETYLKSDDIHSKPKYKIMNIKYFFNLINEKEKLHKILTDKMNVYSLNYNINTNIEKEFNEIEEIMKKLSNKENVFFLNDSLKAEYQTLMQNHENSVRDKERKKSLRRKSVAINLKRINFGSFPFINPGKNE